MLLFSVICVAICFAIASVAVIYLGAVVVCFVVLVVAIVAVMALLVLLLVIL